MNTKYIQEQDALWNALDEAFGAPEAELNNFQIDLNGLVADLIDGGVFLTAIIFLLLYLLFYHFFLAWSCLDTLSIVQRLLYQQ